MSGMAAPSTYFLLALAVLTAALLLLAAMEWTERRARRKTVALPVDAAVFLFQGQILIDATAAGWHLLHRGADHGLRGTDWDHLIDKLSCTYQGLRQAMTGPVRSGQFLGNRPGDDSVLTIDAWDDMVRLTLHDPTRQPMSPHPMAIDAMEDELTTLRGLCHDAPQLMWKEDATGHITWANRAYLDLSDKTAPPGLDTGPVWPPAPVFTTLDRPVDGKPLSRRVSVSLPGAPQPLWFDVFSQRQGAETTHFATDAAAAVTAESQGRKFVQTLTKTFAQLSIGLAIFDRQRRLVMFNPALLDLTHLPVEFLSGRPLIGGFLDRLRDRQMLPEPKNYASWREQVSALELAAAEGTYCENWTLPGGQTYRVTGRPHPDGAIAFTFEDISAEVALTRAFRTELETAQNVLEAMDEAIAVFSGAGTLTMSNAAYSKVWGHSAEEMQDVTLRDEIALWQVRTAPSPLWKSLGLAARTTGRPLASRTPIRMADGRSAVCRCVPIGGGSTLVAFQLVGATAAQLTEPEGDLAPLPELVFRRA